MAPVHPRRGQQHPRLSLVLRRGHITQLAATASSRVRCSPLPCVKVSFRIRISCTARLATTRLHPNLYRNPRATTDRCLLRMATIHLSLAVHPQQQQQYILRRIRQQSLNQWTLHRVKSLGSVNHARTLKVVQLLRLSSLSKQPKPQPKGRRPKASKAAAERQRGLE
jgi:hypothetical protein